MPGYHKFRSKLHHILLIHKAIAAGEYPNSESLARDLELSSRTVRRDIEFMRDVLGAPIAYDPSHRGYRYTERNWSLPGIRVTEGELLGVALAQMALQAYQGTPLQAHVERLVGKVQAGLPDEVKIDSTSLASAFRFSLGPVTPFQPEHWELLAKAAREKKTVWMRYHTIWRDEESEREVDPCLLRCFRGDWYLIAHDHLSGEMRIFSIGRIKLLRDMHRTFEVRDDFDPEEYFSGTFTVSHREERYKVRIQFFDVAARLIAEKVWHPSQKLTRKRDGSIVLEMTVADLDEIVSWVLSWGPMAKVLGPVELRNEVLQAVKGIAGRYS